MSLQLQSGESVEGDLFIDCSGFSAILASKTLKGEFEDWSSLLTVDSAVTVQTKNTGPLPPYTESRAQEFGWSWHIPLQHRTGNGYVFDSQLCHSDDAAETLLSQVSGDPVSDVRHLKFKTGVITAPWKNNCIAVGLSSGFLEPLESTAIHMITRGIKHLIRLFPEQDMNPLLAEEYNRRIRKDYEEIRDFLVMHYCLTQRNDTEFWRYYQAMTLPESLKYKLALFKHRGVLVPEEDDLFVNYNWYSVLEGLAFRPESPDPLIDNINTTALNQVLNDVPQSIAHFINQIPEHSEFISKHCQSDQFLAFCFFFR